MLARYSQRFPTCGENPELRAGAQQRLCKFRASLRQVFAVVEQENRLAVIEPLADGLDERLDRPVTNAEAGRYLLH
jgi:hypothetical protein